MDNSKRNEMTVAIALGEKVCAYATVVGVHYATNSIIALADGALVRARRIAQGLYVAAEVL